MPGGGIGGRQTQPGVTPRPGTGTVTREVFVSRVTEFGNCVQREGAPGPRGAVLPLPGPRGGPGLPVTDPDVRSQQAQPGG